MSFPADTQPGTYTCSLSIHGNPVTVDPDPDNPDTPDSEEPDTPDPDNPDTPDPEEPDKPGPDSPATGDNNLIALGALAVLLPSAGAFVVIRRKSRA